MAQWSTTAADNSDSDAGLPVMSDTMDPIGLDNVPRGMMAALAKWRKDVGGAIEAGGTANALTATSSSGYEAAHLVDGLMVVVRAASANSSATVTLNIDSTGAKGIKRADGSTLAVGSIRANQYLILFYNADEAEWWAANISPAISTLDAIAALAVTDGNIIVGNGSTWVAESGATARTSLGLAIGTDVQAYSAKLAAIAALAVTDGNIIVGNGTTFVAESGSTARTSLGLGTAATQNTGTSGANVPLLNANNTHSGNLTVSGTFSASGTATLGDGSGDTVVVKGTTVHSFSSGLLNNTSAADWRTDLGINTDDAVTFGSLTMSGNNTLTMGGVDPFNNVVNANQILSALGSEAAGSIVWFTGGSWVPLAPPSTGGPWYLTCYAADSPGGFSFGWSIDIG